MPDRAPDPVGAARADFQAHYGREPQWTIVAPGRVNLIGDHTDYTGGLALPFAVDLYTVVCAAPGDTALRLSSASQREETAIDPQRLPRPTGNWIDYVVGVLAGYQSRGHAIPNLDIRVGGNLPLGAGLSSSAALELATATLLEHRLDISLPAGERALLCQRAEHDYAGVPCGILDQFAIAFAREGRLLRLDCRDESVDWIPFPGELSLLVIDSGVRHSHAEGAYAERRRQCERAERTLGMGLREATPEAVERLEDPVVRARARHVISENRRVEALIEALGARDFEQAGAVMSASHRSLALDFEASCDEVDYLVAAATDAGAIGARMTGGGFGGSIVCLLAPESLDSVAESVSSGYGERFGQRATPRPVHPVAAARVL